MTREDFFKSAKLISIIIFALISVSAVHAQNMSSTSYTLTPVLDSAGGTRNTSTYTLSSSIGQPTSGTMPSISFSLCAGWLCSLFQSIVNAKITFLLELNISGPNDQVYVDNSTTLKQYTSSQLTNYYACIQNTSLTNTPTFGIIYAGSVLNYINITTGNSYIMRLSQDVPGNQFILPITTGNCTIFNSRLPEIPTFGTFVQPLRAFGEAVNAVELVLSYPSVQIAGDFDRSGNFKVSIQKNETNENQIIVKPI